jgi:dipeptidyl aminopeptidase/acylaminoacyl peptidase
MNFSRIVAVLILLIITTSGAAPAQTPRGLLPTDLSLVADVADAQISPDGSKVVYLFGSRLWVVPVGGGDPKRLTTGEANESTARWSPDGKWVAFYSNRENRDGLWVVSADGGAPKLAAVVYRSNFYLTKSGESFTWSPDSKQLAFVSSIEALNQPPLAQAAAAVPPGVPVEMTRPLSRDDIEKLPPDVREMIFRAQGQAMGVKPKTPIENSISALPDDPRVITRLQYKNRTGFSDTLQSHLFTVEIDTRKVRQLTTGLYYEHSIHWSPKGDEVAFVSNREPDPDKVNNTDLFVVNVKTFAIRQLTKTKGCEMHPVFSPDGARIAYLASKRELTTIDSVAEDFHVFTMPATGGEPAEIPLDRRVSAVKWGGPDKLIFSYGDSGKTVISVDGRGPAVSFTNPNVQISGFSVAGNGSLAMVAGDESHPPEVFAATAASGGKPTQISNHNQPLLAALKLTSYRELKFVNEGLEIQGWLAPPIDLDENKKYPVVLSIHGGPHGMHGYQFNPTVQALNAQGYAVLLINPRGSSGYGQKFSDGCVNDWGGGDYRDLMKGVDEALTRWPFLDKDRLGVTGGSYGGYMTNWVVTQTERFKAAVSHASLSNLISFYSTSLYQDLVHAEFHGFPWNNFDLLWDRSPLKYIAKAKTPVLLLHGEQDNDVHITQAEEMYTGLRMLGIDAVFVRYPREGHGLRELRHRQDAMARTLQWFDRYLKK